MRIAIGVVLLIAGAACYFGAYRAHRSHPQWRWNTGPQTWIYLLGTLLGAAGLLRLVLTPTT